MNLQSRDSNGAGVSMPSAARVRAVPRSAADYPPGVRTHLGGHAPEIVHAIGNLDILREKKLAFFCSRKCPGTLILKTYDLTRHLRDSGVTVVGGFHSPMEKECLGLLLRGKQPVIVCLARRLVTPRMPKEYRRLIEEGRLLLLSPFGEAVRRVTSDTALLRNRFVAALADEVFVAYAAPGGKTESFCRMLTEWGKPMLTLKGSESALPLPGFMGGRPCASAP